MATSTFRRHRERGGESPLLLLFPCPLDGRRVSPLVLGLHGSGGAGAPLRLDLYLFPSVSMFSDSGLSPFLIFPKIRNSDWAEILTRLVSGYWLSCGERRAPTALTGGHKPTGCAQGRGRPPRACGRLGHRPALILSPKNHIYSKINLRKFLSRLDFV